MTKRTEAKELVRQERRMVGLLDNGGSWENGARISHACSFIVEIATADFDLAY